MMVNNDPKLMENASKIADECGLADGERCDQAFKFSKCAKEMILKEKLDVDFV
jgi:hypothetical protein